jgi:lysophospholipase L1-like esterase
MRSTEWLGRLALIPLGLLIAVMALEALLQVSGLLVRAPGSQSLSWETGGRRVLALGDSNTYGVWLSDRGTEAWPAQLEALWNESDPSRRVEVLNAGFPGTNSSRLLRDFPALLEAFQPDLVIVMVGANDSWTKPVAPGSRKGGFLAFVRRHSRVLRLARLLRPRIEAAQLEVVRVPGDRDWDRGGVVARFGEYEFDGRWSKATPGEGADWDALVQNLREIAAYTRDHGVPLALMTYPSSHKSYGRANVAIRIAARESGAPLIDLAEVFRPLCPQKECPGWFFQDQHPRALGYRLVAETIVAWLREDAR